METEEEYQGTGRAKKVLEHKESQKKAHNAHLALKGQYLKASKTMAVRDLIKTINSFGAYHMKLAKDGTGYENVPMADGSTAQKQVRFTPAERTAHLDRAGGIQEIADYIDRMLTLAD